MSVGIHTYGAPERPWLEVGQGRCGHLQGDSANPNPEGAPAGQLNTWGAVGVCMETLRTATGVESPCAQFEEETCQHDVRRAFGQHGEMGRESGCRGIDILYGDSCVVFEVGHVPQKLPFGVAWHRSWFRHRSGEVLGYRTRAK